MANTLAAVEAGRPQVQGTMNGVGERTGNANLVSIIANLQLKIGHEVLAPERLARLTETAHFVDELLNLNPDPNQPYVGKQRLRAQGRACTSPACAPTRRPSSTWTRRWSATGASCWSPSSRAARPCRRRPPTPASSSTASRRPRVIERVKELEHAGFQFEAADASFELLLRKETGDYEPLFRLESWRVIVEKRADGKVETEATIKIWVDGERYVRTAEGNGPVHALDRALRGGDRDDRTRTWRTSSSSTSRSASSTRRKGSDAVIRVAVDSSDGHDVWGSMGVSTNLIEASWHALVDSLEYGLQGAPARARSASGARRERHPRGDPTRPARAGRSGGARWSSRSCARASCRSARGSPPSRRRFAARLGVAHASAVSSGTAGLHLALRAAGVTDGDEVVTSPFSFVASANAILFERARPVFADIDPVTLNLDPAAAAAAVTPSARPRSCRSTSSATRPTCRPSSASGCRSSRTPARRWAPCTPTARRSAARGHPAVFGFYANKQLTTGEGGMVDHGRRRGEGAHRLRAQPGPGAGHGLARPRPPRLQLPAERPRLRAGPGPARPPGRHARRARAGGRRVPRGAGRGRGAGAAVRGRRAAPASAAAGSCSSSRCRAAATATTVIRALRERGVQCKPYLPAIHLMSLLPRGFGHRPGEFPVCEDVAARSRRAAVLPGLAESQIARVAEALREALEAT